MMFEIDNFCEEKAFKIKGGSKKLKYQEIKCSISDAFKSARNPHNRKTAKYNVVTN